MHFILGIIACLIILFIFWFIGHVILKKLNIVNEENQLLSNLLKICLGASGFLIVINFFSNILKDFNWGLIISFVIIFGIIIWQFNNFRQAAINLKSFLKKENIPNKYFWILFGVINFIYSLTAFSTVKLDKFTAGGGHIYNVNQLLIGNYPPKYSFLPNIPQRYHYGSDIFGALISKFSGLHPEISFDILTLIFLNLSLLTLYALTVKFLNTNPFNKYLVPFGAFLGWGPITLLFKTNPGEVIPTRFLDKIYYLTQTRLIDAANWSGLTLNWFFAPPIGFSIFFFLIALYLLFRFFEGEQSLKFTLLLGIFLSSFVILDFSKFVLLLTGLLIYLLFKLPLPFDEPSKENHTELKSFYKNIGLLFLVFLTLGLINGNFLRFDKAYVSLSEFYHFGKTNMDSKFGPFGSNVILLGIFAFGFYQSYKQKINWINHLIPFFAASLIISYFITVNDAGLGKILMCSSLLGAFTLPLTIDFIKNKLDFKEQKVTAFYTIIFILLSVSTLMFWAFGDRSNPLFTLENGGLKFTGKQVFPFDDKSEEFIFAQKLKSNKLKDSTILSEPAYSEILTINSGAFTTSPIIPNLNEEATIKKQIVDSIAAKFNSLFTLNSNLFEERKIRILYLTPKFIRYMLSPKARQTLLASELTGNGKIIHSNKKEDLTQLKEIYFIDPKKLTYDSIPSYDKKLKTYLKSTGPKNNYSMYLKQIAECPYFGIYNAMSNDFDGDMISDVAFFDYASKKWTIIYGKDQKEEEIDLNNSIFANYNGDLFVPVPSDYDGDSKTDIAFFDENNGRWYIRRSSDLQIDFSKQFGVYIEEIPLPADVDGDLKTDISCFNSNHGTWYSEATTNGFFSNNFGLSFLDIPVFADVDGDKKADYVIYKPDRNIVEAYLSSKLFDRQQHIQLTIGNKNSRLVPEDYDGDGKVDLAVWTPRTGKWEIAYAKDFLTSNLIPGIIPPAFIGCGVPAQPQGTPAPPCATKQFKLGKAGDIPMPGDYNGDGKTEIGVYSLKNSTLRILLPDGSKKKFNFSKYKNLLPVSFIGV